MFEIVRQNELDKWNIKKEDVIIPSRKTKHSAGYDFHIPIDYSLSNVGLIPTGIKCKFPLSKKLLYLQISLKSGFSSKNPVLLRNAPGIIDQDYYNNPDNDGHILLSVYNHVYLGTVRISKGTGIVQGIFIESTTFGEEIVEARKGGFGSTSK